MNNEEKRMALSHTSRILTQANIPHLYNVREETITLRNVDMTDVLLELHFYQDEYISDLKKRNSELEKDLSELTIENDYQRVISNKNEQISVMETTITQAKQVIKYLLQSLEIEGYDFSQSGSATDEYRFYKMAIKILGENNEIHN